MSNFVINSASILKQKLEMVESLSEIEIATKIIENTKNLGESDILNDHYKRLNCDIKGIDKNVILKYNIIIII